MTNTRTNYQREWRQKHPENVRKNRRKSYWNNPEKHRKKARERWKENKYSTVKGKNNDIIAEKVGMSPTTYFRYNYVRKHANVLYEKSKAENNPRPKIYGLYKKVKDDVDRYTFELVTLGDEIGFENITETQHKELQSKFENLTFPFLKN